MLPQELKKHNAKVVMRCCDPSYSIESLKEEGIKVMVGTLLHLPFIDPRCLGGGLFSVRVCVHDFSQCKLASTTTVYQWPHVLGFIGGLSLYPHKY